MALLLCSSSLAWLAYMPSGPRIAISSFCRPLLGRLVPLQLSSTTAQVPGRAGEGEPSLGRLASCASAHFLYPAASGKALAWLRMTTLQRLSGGLDDLPICLCQVSTPQLSVDSTLAQHMASPLPLIWETENGNRWRCNGCSSRCRRSSAAAVARTTSTTMQQHTAIQITPCH